MNSRCEPVAIAEVHVDEQHRLPDIRDAGLPLPTLAIIEALRFRDTSLIRASQLDEKQWGALLPWCDDSQITLMLPAFCGDTLPLTIQQRISRRRTDFEARMRRIEDQLSAVSNVLSAQDLPFVVLKGFTHSPDLTPDPIWRAQGDIDLWCPGAHSGQAYALLQNAGYKSSPARNGRHLPPLLLPEAWQWNGNMADIPISIELHHRLWDDVAEYIPIPGHPEMWQRRQRRSFSGENYDVLSPPDLLGFAALHLFLHLIHGDVPLQRAWEIANFLHNNSNDSQFWSDWRISHPPELREIQALVFRIVESWFHCATPTWIAEEIEALPEGVKLWLDHFVFSPLRSQTDSNKNYLWLHLSMIPSFAANCRVLTTCFFPRRLPNFVDRIDEDRVGSGLASLLRQQNYLVKRLKRHTQSIKPTLRGGLLWLTRRAGLAGGFGPFLLASALFDVGEFLFVLLYSLYLLDRGFREDVLGLVTAAMMAGTLFGTPIAALVERRIGLRGLLVLASLGGGGATVLRVISNDRASLLLTAGLNGVFFAFWAVAFAPVVAGLTRPRNRSMAFGFVTAMGMSIGILVGLIGVRLPAWMMHFAGVTAGAGKQLTILAGSLLIMLAAIPAMRLRIPHRPLSSATTYPRGPFIRYFLVALFLWITATNCFNGFANAYLSLRLHLSLQNIGAMFSGAQTLQVLAVLCGPLLIRRLGESRYLVWTALGTASMLLLLAISSRHLAVAAYLSYMTLQYMNEPSLFGMLMNRVGEGQRTGASSLMLITMSIAGTMAAALAGKVITRFDYSVCLSAAALIAATAASLFALLPRRKSEI